MSEIEWSPWIRHVGEECPVPDNIRCQIKMRDGRKYLDDGMVADEFFWKDDGQRYAVTHYRIPMADYQRIYGSTADDQEEPYQSVTVPVDPLESHPDSEPDADRYSVGADSVNHPAHYVSGGIECIDAIKAQMTPEQYAGYLRGNVAKYLWRYERKGGAESLRKARWYLDRLIAAVDDE